MCTALLKNQSCSFDRAETLFLSLKRATYIANNNNNLIATATVQGGSQTDCF